MAGTLTASIVKNDTTNPPAFQNSAGTEVGTLCRAWVRFTGSTASINGSFNVSSVTRNSAGYYTINLSNALSSANYAAVISASALNGAENSNFEVFSNSQTAIAPTTSSFAVWNGAANWVAVDPTYFCAAVFL